MKLTFPIRHEAFDFPGAVVSFYSGMFLGVVFGHYTGTLLPAVIILSIIAAAHLAIAVLWLGRNRH